MTIPETSSIQTSGEREMNKLDYSRCKLSIIHLPDKGEIGSDTAASPSVQSLVTTEQRLGNYMHMYVMGLENMPGVTCGWFQSKGVMYYTSGGEGGSMGTPLSSP